MQQRLRVAAHPAQRAEEPSVRRTTTQRRGVLVVDFAAQQSTAPRAVFGRRDGGPVRDGERQLPVQAQSSKQIGGQRVECAAGQLAPGCSPSTMMPRSLYTIVPGGRCSGVWSTRASERRAVRGRACTAAPRPAGRWCASPTGGPSRRRDWVAPASRPPRAAPRAPRPAGRAARRRSGPGTAGSCTGPWSARPGRTRYRA